MLGEKILKFVNQMVRGQYYDRPMPAGLKEQTLLDSVKRSGARIFIETGTYLGDTSESISPNVDKVFTIEISEALAEQAKVKFKDTNVEVIQGDSGKVLNELLTKVEQKCFFWLDGHYSAGVTSKGEKDTPIMEELIPILNHKVKDHTIYIDDARCFNNTYGYPLPEHISKLIEEYGNNYKMIIRNDIIRLLPK